MNLRRAIPIVSMVLAASFAGGAFSHFILTGRPAVAEEGGNPKWLRTVTLYLVDDSSDQVRGVLTIEGSGKASLALRDGKGVDRLDLLVDAGGDSSVKLHGAKAAKAELAIREGQASLELTGAGGVVNLSLQDGPQLELKSSQGQSGAQLSIKDGLPALQMFDGAGNVIWQAPPVEEETE